MNDSQIHVWLLQSRGSQPGGIPLYGNGIQHPGYERVVDQKKMMLTVTSVSSCWYERRPVQQLTIQSTVRKSLWTLYCNNPSSEGNEAETSQRAND